MDRELAKKKAQSRDCHCINGEDRDSNFNAVIDEVFDYFENKVNNGVLADVINCDCMIPKPYLCGELKVLCCRKCECEIH